MGAPPDPPTLVFISVPDSKKFSGLRPENFFSPNFFRVAPILRRRFRRRNRASAKISDVGENLGRWRKSRASAKISGVGENLGRWRKSRALAKISGVGENLRRPRFSPT